MEALKMSTTLASPLNGRLNFLRRPPAASFRGPLRLPHTLTTAKAIKDTMDAPAVADWRTGAAALLLSLHVAIVMPCCQGKPATAAEYPPAQVTAGQAVFNNNCAACHTGGQNIIESEKTLEKEALVEYLKGGYNYDAIVTQVQMGMNSMPAWINSLSDEQIKAVSAYVYTQADKELW